MKKINLDAFVLYNVEKMLYGTIVRNFQKVFVVSLTGYFKYFIDFILVEFQTLRDVLS